ncbi:hypothetical protein HD596_007141 [Nonomuraea jabiensis]|uniref:Uncharacterized protein n=1 Tax=Nonomuraea jabiensis TaxID=882448 RepID=A0A7W9LE17_9ACTN|nr:hypothetical protein [Nonomuraea jabiensis]
MVGIWVVRPAVTVNGTAVTLAVAAASLVGGHPAALRVHGLDVEEGDVAAVRA